MTVNSTDTFAGPYAPNGVTTVFPFSFAAQSAADVEVTIDGEVVSGYSVTISADGNSGSAVFSTAPTGDELLVILAPSFQQEIAFKNQAAFLPTAHDTANDRAAMRDLYLLDRAKRSITAPVGEEMGLLPPAADRAGKFLGFGVTGLPVISSGTGNDPDFRNDIAEGNGSLVGATATDAGAEPMSLAGVLESQSVNLLSFIPEGSHAAFRNGSLGNIDAALQKFHDALKTRALAGHTPAGYIPSGKIVTSLDLNWAMRGLVLFVGGEVEWQYTGVGSGFRMDGTAVDAVLPRLLDADGVTPIGVYNCTVHPGIVVRADTGTGIYVRKMHHCEIAIRCKSALDVAFKLMSNVNSTFRRMCISYNQQPLNVVPPIGLLVSGAAGDQSAYCEFYGCIQEGPATGVKCDYALGNMFFGGGAEGCATVGLQTTINSQGNRFYGQDYEQNNPSGTKVDVLMDGIGNEFHGSETQNLFKFTGNAYACRLIGGVHNAITFDAVTADNVIDGASYNRQATGATITDSSTLKLNRTCNITDRGAERTYNAVPTATVIDMSAQTSPFLYENTSRMDQLVSISGTTNCGRLRPLGGGPVSGGDQGAAGEFMLQPGDKVNAYWSSGTPTFVVFSI